MLPEEARKAALASQLFVAYSQADEYECLELLNNFSNDAVQDVTDGMIYLAVPCAHVIADAKNLSFREVLESLPRKNQEFVPDVRQEWDEAVGLIDALNEGNLHADSTSMDIPTALHSLFSVVYSLIEELSTLANMSFQQAATIFAEGAARETNGE